MKSTPWGVLNPKQIFFQETKFLRNAEKQGGTVKTVKLNPLTNTQS
jgi:hypothetical protein